MHRSKVPNGADAAVHEQVAYLLRARRGNGDYAYMYVHLAAEALELGYRENRLALVGSSQRSNAAIILRP